jgi:hypothetical protein
MLCLFPGSSAYHLNDAMAELEQQKANEPLLGINDWLDDAWNRAG